MQSRSSHTIVTDADCVLGRALCDALARKGCPVIAHVRAAPALPFTSAIRVVVAARLDLAMASWNTVQFPVDHIVFGQPPDLDDVTEMLDGLDRLADLLEARLTQFLAELQAAGRLLVRNQDGGQIWVLTQEDSMRYYAKLPSVPIESRARQAVIKSFAKEVFRFGVRVNCANVQLLAEQASPEDWSAARPGLKSFAMKFKPNRAESVAEMLCGFLGQADLPIAGMVIPIGIGFSEQSI